jgi:hypothetical protein
VGPGQRFPSERQHQTGVSRGRRFRRRRSATARQNHAESRALDVSPLLSPAAYRMIVLNSGFEVAAGRRRQCARRPARWANLRNSSGFLRRKARVKGARRPGQRRTWAEMRRYRVTNARFPAHSRCCLRDPGRSALRPIEASKARSIMSARRRFRTSFSVIRRRRCVSGATATWSDAGRALRCCGGHGAQSNP